MKSTVHSLHTHTPTQHTRTQWAVRVSFYVHINSTLIIRVCRGKAYVLYLLPHIHIHHISCSIIPLYVSHNFDNGPINWCTSCICSTSVYTPANQCNALSQNYYTWHTGRIYHIYACVCVPICHVCVCVCLCCISMRKSTAIASLTVVTLDIARFHN